MIVLALLCCVLLAAVFVFVMLWRDAVAERDACQEELECVWKELNTVRLLREQLAGLNHSPSYRRRKRR
jgi:hypothetical protein